jgi:hypothetical protein
LLNDDLGEAGDEGGGVGLVDGPDFVEFEGAVGDIEASEGGSDAFEVIAGAAARVLEEQKAAPGQQRPWILGSRKGRHGTVPRVISFRIIG